MAVRQQARNERVGLCAVRRRSVRPHVESLEDRTLLSVVVSEDFNPGGPFSRNGSAQISNGALRLTSGAGQAGSLWLNQVVQLDNFTATFDVQLSGKSKSGWGDGFTLAVLDAKKNGAKALGGKGGMLGYGGLSGFAIEFDTHQNTSNSFQDPKFVHVGLDVNGRMRSASLSALPFDIRGAGTITVQITYADGTVTVSLGRPSGSLQQVLSRTLKADDRPQTGRIGFTGATGAAFETVTVDNLRLLLPNVYQPTVNVITPPTFREGDVFTITVAGGKPNSPVTAQVIGDNNSLQYPFEAATTDSNGNLVLPVRMPYILAAGYEEDGRTIRVSNSGATQDLYVKVHEGQRVGLSTDTWQEGGTITATIRNGVPESQVIFQILHDGTVVHEWGFRETDSDGSGKFDLVVPAVLLGPSYRIDGFVFRTIHNGVITDKGVAITEGLRIVIGAENVREGGTFPVEVRNGPPNTSASFAWYLDDSYRTTQTGTATNGDGDADFRLTVPKVILNSADSDAFRLVATIDGHDFEFKLIVYKQGEPTVGSFQDRSAAPAPDKKNSVPKAPSPASTDKGVNAQSLLDGETDPQFGIDPASYLKELSTHQLVILCYGRGQEYGKVARDNNLPGMDAIYDDINPSIAADHILLLPSGTALGLKNSATSDGENAIANAIAKLAASGIRIDDVILVGYSWGGGMAKELGGWIEDTYSGQIEIAGLAYIDAVKHAAVGRETGIPKNVKSLLNIYQSNLSETKLIDTTEKAFLLGSGSIRNPGLPGFDGPPEHYFGRYREYDVDKRPDGKTSERDTHYQIDNDKQVTGDVVNFIEAVISGWYTAWNAHN